MSITQMAEPDTNNTALDLQAIATRARHLLTEAGKDGTEFAKECGVPYSTMRAYLSGQRAPGPEFLVGIYRAFGFNPAWLLTGDGGMRFEHQEQHKDDAFVVVPMLGIKASAGNGWVNEPEAEYKVGSLSFSSAWISQRRLSPEKLRVIEVAGASMNPVLSDGDMVLIDLADRTPRSGVVYVLRQGEELLIKYCQLLPGGVLRVTSANQAYAAYDVDLKTNHNVEVVGRVVASMHEW